MTDPIVQLCQLAIQQLQESPDLEPDQRVAALREAIATHPELVTALQTDSRVVQINQGNAHAFQTWVSGGIANIGINLNNADGETIKTILADFFRGPLPVGIPQNLPRSGATKFVGRDDDLTKLHTELKKADRLAITAIRGMGGIGKTELALQYASYHLQQGTYPGGICWLRVRDQEIGIQIVSFAQAILGLTLPDGLDLSDQVAHCWHHWPEGDVLVIVDDVADYGAIKAYLPPQTPRFWVLLTTRLHLGTSIQAFEIQVLTETAALQLLESLVGAERMAAEPETAQALCEWLGYLPLGLELVGRYLEQDPDLTLAQMLARLKDNRLQETSLTREDDDPTWSSTAQYGVAAAFDLSLGRTAWLFAKPERNGGAAPVQPHFWCPDCRLLMGSDS